MNSEEQLVADTIYEAMHQASADSVRSRKAKNEFTIGVSDLGFCPERTRRTLDGQVPEDVDTLQAFIGTAVGDHVEQAVTKVWPEAMIQEEVIVPLEGEERIYNLIGHPDIVLPDGLVLDVKTVDGLALMERTGPKRSQEYQRNLYGLGCWMKGLFDPAIELDEVRVGNVWVDRSGKDQRLHVDIAAYDPDITLEAGQWIDEVVYNYLHDQEAEKAPPRDVCERYCGFFKVCRLHDTDVEGLITDPELLSAVDLYVEGRDMSKEGERLKKQAQSVLADIRHGNTGEFQVRWTWVNPTEIEAYTRSGYDKLEVRRVRKK